MVSNVIIIVPIIVISCLYQGVILKSTRTSKLLVETSTGWILGKERKTVDLEKPYHAFLGVPYGEPPIGDLRFRAPVPVKPWYGTKNATEKGNACVQLTFGHEDCLNLNVYVPQLDETDSTLLPVIAYIHGGFFMAGDAGYKLQAPDYFLEEDIIFVSINYRVDILGFLFQSHLRSEIRYKLICDKSYFVHSVSSCSDSNTSYSLASLSEAVKGMQSKTFDIATFNYEKAKVLRFLSTEDDAAYGNWGLKDQILALEWVQENIEYFGGDKSNVTLMGHSAGSVSAHYLIQTPKTKDLVHRAIMLSGTSLNRWAFTKSPRNMAFVFGEILNVYTEDSTELIKQLRRIEPHKLSILSTILVVLFALFRDWKEGFIFSPSKEPEHDGAVVLGYSFENLEKGNFNNIPVLMGFVSQEGIIFYPAFNSIRPYLLQYDLFKERLIPGDMNVDSLKKPEVGNEIKQTCFGDELVVSSSTDLIQYITEDQFVRPIMETARLMTHFTRLYFYRFSYMGEGNLSDGTGIGVGHAEDLDYLFYYGYTNQSVGDILTRQRFVKLCSNFVKTSYPTLDEYLNPGNVSWPRYLENGTYLDIGENLTLQNDLDRYRFHWWRHLYNTYGTRPFNTY